ncbi:DUF1343 domain-containing protein [Candidatus Dependentiae bacterium]|nr:DUF1343 domain-containing protein [Candidatus Dependentiae bacterium]
MIRGAVRVIDSICAVLKVFFLFLFALFLPRIFLYQVTRQKLTVDDELRFKLGLENITSSFLKDLTGTQDHSCSIGLITNQTGKDQKGCSNIDVLRSKGLLVTKIFTPEHGFSCCNMQNTTIPVISLYDKKQHKVLDRQLLDDIDVLIFDIQDAGMRHYSYIDTLLHTIKAAASYNKLLVVLDRPNLLGASMEGTILAHGDEQTNIPIPVRYGMTVGEIARYLNNQVVSSPAQLHVVPMSNYDRHAWAGNLPCQLSPNIATLDSCYGYSFLGLIGEVVPFDIGIGTDKAFQCILLPESLNFSKKKWYELQVVLKKLGVESTFYRYFSQRKKQYCSGLRLCISNIDQFSSFNTLLTILQFFKDTGITLSFSENFDTALGGTQVREFLEGKIEKNIFEYTVNKELKLFFNKASSSFLYQPLPKVVMV